MSSDDEDKASLLELFNTGMVNGIQLTKLLTSHKQQIKNKNKRIAEENITNSVKRAKDKSSKQPAGKIRCRTACSI
jgi:hypothetical protein